MNIIKLCIKNFRCIELQEVDFVAGKITKLIGKNGAGKSSIIDAIFSAIQGGSLVKGKKWRRYQLGNLVRHGEHEARILIDLEQDQKSIRIARSITKDSSGGSTSKQLEISFDETLTTKDVMQLFSLLSIDIVEFMHASPADQFEKILEVVDRSKLQALEFEQSNIKDKLSEYNVHKRKVDDIIRNSEVKTPVRVVDTSEISRELSETRQAMDVYNASKRDISIFQSEIEGVKTGVGKLDEIIEEQKRQLSRNEGARDQEQQKLKDMLSKKEGMIQEHNKKYYAEFSTEKQEAIERLESELENSSGANKQATLFESYKKACEEKTKLDLATGEEKAKLAQIVKQKSDLFKTAGITSEIVYDEERGLVIDNNIFSDLSSGQKVRTIVNILATLKQNRVNLLIVRDASILDNDTMQVLREVAQEHKLSVLLEIVEDVAGDTPIIVKVEE